MNAARVRHRSRRMIRRFDDDGHPTPEALAAEDRTPRASPGIARISGVSDGFAPGAIGKLHCAVLPEMFRPTVGLNKIFTLQRLLEVPPTARIYEERNGKGRGYFRLRYRSPRGRRQHSIHLGNDPDVAQWARDIMVERRWADSRDKQPAIDQIRITRLRALRSVVRRLSIRLAAQAGFGFHGRRLVETRT